MLFAMNAVGDVFRIWKKPFFSREQDHVIVLKKNKPENRYEMSRRWGHGRFCCIASIVITQADDGGVEVVWVSDSDGIQMFRPDGSFLRCLQLPYLRDEESSELIAAFGQVYFLNKSEIFAVGRDGTLLFRFDLVVTGWNMTVLGDELFVLSDPNLKERALHVFSAYDGTLLRRTTIALADPFTRIVAAPSEGLLLLISDWVVKRMKPDFTLLELKTDTPRITKSWGVVWHRGKVTGLNFHGFPVE